MRCTQAPVAAVRAAAVVCARSVLYTGVVVHAERACVAADGLCNNFVVYAFTVVYVSAAVHRSIAMYPCIVMYTGDVVHAAEELALLDLEPGAHAESAPGAY